MRSLIAAIAVAAMALPAVAEVTRQSFDIRTAGDLATLCATPATDPNHDAAIGFCFGFGRGAAEYHREITPPNAPRLACVPSPVPDDVRERFIAWAKADPRNAAQRPVEGMFRFLSVTFPCPR